MNLRDFVLELTFAVTTFLEKSKKTLRKLLRVIIFTENIYMKFLRKFKREFSRKFRDLFFPRKIP